MNKLKKKKTTDNIHIHSAASWIDPSHNENLVYFHANKCLGEEF